MPVRRARARAGVLAALLAALAACSGSPTAHPAPGRPAPAMPGGLPEDALRGLLLQPADVPSTTSRRDSATTAATSQPVPQLALCRLAVPVGPHQVASVLAKPAQPGSAQVFELVQVFADAAAATTAFDSAAEAAEGCHSYTQGETAFTVEDLRRFDVRGADQAVQYRLSTPDVVLGDVRTLARAGRFLVLISGFGAPPDAQPPLAFQSDVATRAVARLPRG